VHALVLLLLAAPPEVGYRVAASAGSWQPLEPADVALAIEHAALEVLTRPGLMQLVRLDPKDRTPKGDYLLSIKGRLLDEAETHTVYLSFEPGKRSDLPSFNASATVVLSKLPRKAMLEKIDESARKAAAQLLDALGPSLKRSDAASEGKEAQASIPSTLPFQWADVRIPSASFGRSSGDLYAKKQELREAALRELTSLALIEPTPRNVLETCTLKHPDPAMRLGCLEALRPLSRTIAPTQRVVIEAYRRDPDEKVAEQASEQMMYFTGLSLAEAVQAWLERAGRCQGKGALENLGDVPNLDLAIAQCLQACAKKPKYQRSKRSCVELLHPIPSYSRRRALLLRYLAETDPNSPYYLEGAGEREGSIGTEWQWAVEALLDRAPRWDPELEEILWKRYQRTLSSSSIQFLSEYGDPSKRLADHLLEVVQTAGDHRVLWGLERFAKESPELAPAIKDKLAELEATGSFPGSLGKDALKEAIQKIERNAQKGKGK
jgi:hypothetical protein